MKSDERHPTGGIPTWIKVTGGFVTFALFAVGIIFALDVISTARWRRVVGDLRAEGQPITRAEIEGRRPEVPDEQNGALVITEHLDAISGVTGGQAASDVFVFGAERQESDFFSGIVHAKIDPSRALRDRNQALLDDLAKLVDLPTGRLHLAQRGDLLANLPAHLTPLRTASKLEHLDCILRLIDNDVDEAVRTVLVQFGLAGTLETEPTVISRLVQIAIQAQATQSIEQILRAAEPDAQQVARLQERLKPVLAQQTMKWALWGERAFVVEIMEGLTTGTVNINNVQSLTGSAGVFAFWRPIWLVRENQLKATEMYGWLVDAGDDPDALLAAAKQLDSAVGSLSVKYALVKLLTPSLSRAVELHIRLTARLRATKAVLAAERFRLDTGRLPASLDEIVPAYLDAVPIDPFDGRPLRLVTVPEGIVIYSIGEDGVDNGGSVELVRQPPRIPDAGLRLFAPQHRGVQFTTDTSPD